jgi:hypothetical protein
MLVCLFLVASLVALYEVATTPRAFSNTANSSGSIETIRSFYAGLNDYMAMGDAGAVASLLAPGAWAPLPEHGAMGDDSELLTYLIALRSTLPNLRFIVDRIEAGEDLAIATVRRVGTAGSPAFSSAPGTSQEFFRVRDGRIVQHWTTAPGTLLLHPLTVPPIFIDVIQPGHLAIAELSFSPGHNDPQPIDGPALLIVQRGRLTLTGGGSSQIVDMATGTTSAPGTNEPAAARPGQAISIPEYRAYVRNEGSKEAVVRLATLVDDPRQILATIPGDRHPPPLAINDMAMMGSDVTTDYGSVTVRPLEFDDRSSPTGHWELDVAWAVIGPGTSLPWPAAGSRTVAHVISGSASPRTLGQHGAGVLSALTNDAETPALALVITLRPTRRSDVINA